MSVKSFADLRREMVDLHLRPRGINDERVLAAMLKVRREEFVPPDLADHAYDDGALPIGFEQTISQPFVVAFMAQEVRLRPGDRVLELGTGSGYGAAVLSRLCREVHTVERMPELAERAQLKLAALGYDNVQVHVGDGTLGWPDGSPYNAILITAGGTIIPPPLVEQLADGGHILIPLGERSRQRMKRLTRTGGTIVEDGLGPFAFVPLIGKHGWPAEA